MSQLTQDKIVVQSGKILFIPSGSLTTPGTYVSASIRGSAVISCSNNYDNALAKPNLRYTSSVRTLVTQSDFVVNNRRNETGYFLFSTTKRIVVCYYVTSSTGPRPALGGVTGSSAMRVQLTGSAIPKITKEIISESFEGYVTPSASLQFCYVPIPIENNSNGTTIMSASVLHINANRKASKYIFAQSASTHVDSGSYLKIVDLVGGGAQLTASNSDSSSAGQVFISASGFRAASQSAVTSSGRPGLVSEFRGTPSQSEATIKFEIDPQDRTSFIITGSQSSASLYFSGSGKIGIGTKDPKRALDIIDKTLGKAEFAIKKDRARETRTYWEVGDEIGNITFVAESGSFVNEASGAAAGVEARVAKLEQVHPGGPFMVTGEGVLTSYKQGTEYDVLKWGLGQGPEQSGFGVGIYSGLIVAGKLSSSGDLYVGGNDIYGGIQANATKKLTLGHTTAMNTFHHGLEVQGDVSSSASGSFEYINTSQSIVIGKSINPSVAGELFSISASSAVYASGYSIDDISIGTIASSNFRLGNSDIMATLYATNINLDAPVTASIVSASTHIITPEMQGTSLSGDQSGSMTLSGSLTLRDNFAKPSVSASTLYNSGSTLYWGSNSDNEPEIPIGRKQLLFFPHGLADTNLTTKHYVPWMDTTEQTTAYSQISQFIAPADCRLKKVLWNQNQWNGDTVVSMSLEKWDVGDSNLSGTPDVVGQVSIAHDDSEQSHHTMVMDFENDLDANIGSESNFIKAGARALIGIITEDDVQVGAGYLNLTSVWEIDYGTMLTASTA